MSGDPSKGGSLRWNDPGRFDGFDLSRTYRLLCQLRKSRPGTAPLANTVMMGVLAPFGKSRNRSTPPAGAVVVAEVAANAIHVMPD
jgi:hypothetical protein